MAREKEAALAARREAERQEKQRQIEAETRKKAQEKKAKATVEKPKLPFKFQKLSLQDIEWAIAEAEQKVQTVEQSFGDPKVATNPDAMRKLQDEYRKAKGALAELMSAWEIKGDTKS